MNKMITILGPTASGKTNLAVAVAAKIGAEIISADSRQVYKRMDIGTGKDLEEYCVDGQHIPYHLIDIVEPGTKYNLFEYQRDFHRSYNEIIKRGVVPLLCGGTGLYIEAVINGYELSPVPQNEKLRTELANKSMDELSQILSDLKAQSGSIMHNTTDVDSTQRAIRAIEIEKYNLDNPTERRVLPPIDTVIIGVNVDREERRRKISARLKYRLEHGLIEEIKQLIESGVSAESLEYYGLEYKFVTEYVLNNISYEEMYNKLEIAIHQFAKRQMTWFRGMERRGSNIHWIDSKLEMKDKINEIIDLWQ